MDLQWCSFSVQTKIHCDNLINIQEGGTTTPAFQHLDQLHRKKKKTNDEKSYKYVFFKQRKLTKLPGVTVFF